MLVRRLLEDGGTVVHFYGDRKGCTLDCALRIHSPAFYWKVILFSLFNYKLSCFVLARSKVVVYPTCAGGFEGRLGAC